MAFDLSTATPIQQAPTGSGGFDLSTAQPVGNIANQQMTQQPPQAGNEQLASAVDNAMQGKGLGTLAEFAAGVNRSIFGALDFLGPDNINAILNIAGSDSQVPTFTESFGAEAGQFDPSLLGKMAGGAGEFAAAGLGAGAVLRQGAKVLPQLVGAGESAGAGVLRQMGQSTAAADVGLGAASGAGSELGREVGGETGAIIGGLAAPLAAVTAPAAIKSIFQYQTPAKQAMADILKSSHGTKETLGYKLSGSGRTIKDSAQVKAVEQGWDEGIVSPLASMNKATKREALKMVNAQQLIMNDKLGTFERRVSDTVGKSLSKRINAVVSENKKAARQLDSIARKSLKNKDVDYNLLIDDFIGGLDGMGVKIKNDGIDFSQSIIRDVPTAKSLIRKTVNTLEEFNVSDAYDAHRMKQALQESIKFGKELTGGKNKANDIVDKLRAGINTQLRDISPEYKAINEKISESLGVIKNLSKATPSKVDISNLDKETIAQLGTTLRTTLSNNTGRGDLLKAVKGVDDLAAKYGKSFDDDIKMQILIADELDRMFGASASTGLKGQVSQAMQAGSEAVQGNTAAATKAAAKGLFGRGKNINEKNAFKAIRNLLKEGAE